MSNHDPEQLLRRLADRPADVEALERARTDLDRRIATNATAAKRSGVTTVHPRRLPVMLAVGVAALVAAFGIASVWPTDTSDPAAPNDYYGEVVAAGPESHLVPGREPSTNCEGRAEHVPVPDTVAGGVGYLVEGVTAPEFVNARFVDLCASVASIDAAYIRSDDGVLTGAVTIWGPDVGAEGPMFAGPSATEEVDVNGSEATLTSYDAEEDSARAYDGVRVVGWSDEDGDWVVTASGLSDSEVIAIAREAASGNPAPATDGVLAGFRQMNPQSQVTMAGYSWIAPYGETELDDPECGMGCTRTSLPDHFEVEVETLGAPWYVEASTRTVNSPYPNMSAELRLIEVDGTPALFNRAGESGLQGEVRWEIAPGVHARIRGSWGAEIDGIIPFAQQVEAVDADDPRITTVPADDGD